MSIEDLQFSNLWQHFWGHLLQKNYTKFKVWFWESSCSKWRLYVFFVFLQLIGLRMRILMLYIQFSILDSANVLKIIFPSSIIFLILHILKTFCILVMLFTKIFCVFNFWLQEKCTAKISIISVVKSIHLITQTAILTPFREPMPATSHFNI